MSHAMDRFGIGPECKPLIVLHCVGTYLRTTENWTYRLIKHQSNSDRQIASERFLECGFELPHSRMLRSPLQPKLFEGLRASGFARYFKAASRITYPLYLRIALLRKRIDVVHSHFAQVGWRYRRLPDRLGAVHVVSFYGWDYVRMAAVDPAWAPRLRALYATVDAFVCEGPHGASLLARNGCPEAKIHIAKLGVEPDQIPVFKRVKRSGELRLLQLASFREKKGQMDAVGAFAIAVKERPNMHLTFIGASSGPIQEQVRKLVQEHKLEGKVSLLPGVAFEHLHDAMQDYDVFIHPSRHAGDGDCEGGAPVVLLDAQATGMPVISTTHCDIPEEVLDGITGILCEERDIAALADAISAFYDMDEIRYQGYADAARNHVEQHFDARVCAAQVESLYRELLTARNEQ